jgi:hypothetical protein
VRRKRRESFKGHDSSLVGCGTVSTEKRFLPQENISYNLQWKNNGILF